MFMDTLRLGSLFGIPYFDWIKDLAIAATTIVVLWGVRELMVSRLKGAAKTETWVDDLLLVLARRTSRVYILAMGITAAGAYEAGAGVLPVWLRVFTIGAFCLQLLRWSNVSVEFWLAHMQRTSAGQQGGGTSLAVVGVLIRVVVFVVVLVLALDNFGVSVTTLITGLGITGIAVALSVQNILGDLLAALAIAFDKPFVVGDDITVGEISGRVEKVGLKTTRLRLGTGEEVSVANAEVLKTRLTNVSRTATRMIPLTVGVSANGETGASLLALAERCQAAAESVPGVVRASARLQSVVDGRARVIVESVLDSPQSALATRPLLIAALTDAARTDTREVLGVG